MYPFLRLGKVLAGAPRRARLDPLADSVLDFRVWPGDLDQNRHLNNGRYLTMMDLGRFDLVSRTGLMRHLVRNRWYPVVTGATIRFRRAIDAFQSYQLRTRIIAWDEAGFFLEQRFERQKGGLGGLPPSVDIHAVGVIKGVFLGREGKVPTQRIVDLVSPGTVSPALPAWVATWDRSQQELSAALKTE